jgi:hypothetical protein
MSAPVQLPTELQQDNCHQLLEIARHIRGLSQSASAAVIEIGRGLLRAKGLVDHGSFGPWVKSACGFTPRSAQNYMRAALLADDKSETVSLLSLGAIYLLSSKSTPAAVVSIVFRWLEEGRVASETEVELLLIQHRQIGCLDQGNDQSNVTDQSAALASELLHFAGPELALRLTEAPWNHVRIELRRLLNMSTSSGPADRQPMCDHIGGSELAAGIDLVRDAEDNNLFRAERGDAGEIQPAPIGWLVDDSVLTVPLEPAAAADDMEGGDDRPALRQAIGGADFGADFVQPQHSPVITSVDFLADTEGPLEGIPNFLRRAKPTPSLPAEQGAIRLM